MSSQAAHSVERGRSPAQTRCPVSMKGCAQPPEPRGPGPHTTTAPPAARVPGGPARPVTPGLAGAAQRGPGRGRAVGYEAGTRQETWRPRAVTGVRGAASSDGQQPRTRARSASTRARRPLLQTALGARCSCGALPTTVSGTLLRSSSSGAQGAGVCFLHQQARSHLFRVHAVFKNAAQSKGFLLNLEFQIRATRISVSCPRA